MSMIGGTPVHRMMEEEAARAKARRDWAYQDEMRKLKEKKEKTEYKRWKYNEV